jgi:DNA-binding MarR family transcriptional regulator
LTSLPEDLPDHLGWLLWLASRQWQTRFVAAMRDAGHEWFTDGRANLLAHVARAGTPQSVLIVRMGISKQAVQQLVDGLVGEGVLERISDPKDSRSRIVRYTARGARAIRDADAIKLEIEAEYRKRLGAERFAVLMEILRDMIDDRKDTGAD